jgi:hypothetical protein
MATQGPQMTLGELPEGTPPRPKAWQKAEMASDMATRSASFCSAASASALQFLTDSSRAVSNPTDSRTTFFRCKEKNGDKNKVTERAKHTFGPGTLLRGHSLGGPSRPDGHGQTLRKGLGPSGRLRVQKGVTPSAPKSFPRKSFSTKMTYAHFDCVDNGIQTTSERDLERQGRPSRGTPTPPGYGYLTRHLPRKLAHARISDSATDEQVLMLETRGKKHDFIPKCSGLGSHKEQTHIHGITMVPRLRRRQRPRRFSRPTADVLVLKAITSCSQEGTITNGTPAPLPQE